MTLEEFNKKRYECNGNMKSIFDLCENAEIENHEIEKCDYGYAIEFNIWDSEENLVKTINLKKSWL